MSNPTPPPDPYGAPPPPEEYGKPPTQYGTPPGQPPGGVQSYPSPESHPPGDSTGFFGALFDFSFNHFVTPKIVKFVYVLATIGLAILYVVFVVASFSQNAASGIIVLLLGAVAFLVYLAFIRMTLEFYFALVRMSEDIHDWTARRTGG